MLQELLTFVTFASVKVPGTLFRDTNLNHKCKYKIYSLFSSIAYYFLLKTVSTHYVPT